MIINKYKKISINVRKDSAPLYGFINVEDPIFKNTLQKIESELKIGNFVKRYKTDFIGRPKITSLKINL